MVISLARRPEALARGAEACTRAPEISMDSSTFLVGYKSGEPGNIEVLDAHVQLALVVGFARVDDKGGALLNDR